MRADEVTGSFVPSKDPAVASVTLDDEVVLYHEGLNTVHVLNATASFIWNAIDGTSTVEEISAPLASEFDVPAAQIARDVLLGVREFGRQGLLSAVELEPEAVDANRVVGRDEPEAPDG